VSLTEWEGVREQYRDSANLDAVDETATTIALTRRSARGLGQRSPFPPSTSLTPITTSGQVTAPSGSYNARRAERAPTGVG
jgi:hypothetical protein